MKLALTPLNVTSVALPTAWPSIVTSVPVGAAAGVNALIVGGRMTSNTLGLDAVPAPVLTVMRFVVASDGTVITTWVSLDVTTVAETEPMRTSCGSVSVVPVIVTVSPMKPLDGETLVIAGSTLNTAELLAEPAAFVTHAPLMLTFVVFHFPASPGPPETRV